MELYTGVYQIHSLFAGRDLFQYLFVGDRIVLLDAGIGETPETVIFPYLNDLRIKPQQLALVVVTHADADHQGGIDAIKQASPETWLACGVEDQAMIEDPQVLWDLRYTFLREGYGLELDALDSARSNSRIAGNPRKVDLCFVGGEKIRIDDGWELEVLHVPGHSRGHLGLYDRKHETAFVSDALHGRGFPGTSGDMAVPVTYYDVDLYLSTLCLLEKLPIKTLCTGHFPPKHGEAIGAFIADSRQTAVTFDHIILAGLVQHDSGLNMKELIDVVGNAFGDWPKDTWIYLMFALKGHLDRLERQGRVRFLQDLPPFRWALA